MSFALSVVVAFATGAAVLDKAYLAAEIAVREVRAFLAGHPDLEVVFCCFSKRDGEVYESLLSGNDGV